MDEQGLHFRIEALGRRRRARRLGLDPVAVGIEPAKASEQLSAAETCVAKSDAPKKIRLGWRAFI